MLKFEAIRINPTPGEIVELLSEATVAANKRCRTRLLADDPAKWRKLAHRTQKTPEGFELVRGGRTGLPDSQLVAAWWTDHIGRKHFVVRCRRIEHYLAQSWLIKSQLDQRPPLWHCYPELIFRRHLGNEQEWLVVCGCGAIGTPTALGWMGDCCGPCHDRREELGEDSLRENRSGMFLGQRGLIAAVAFSHTSEHLAAAEFGGEVDIWSLTHDSTVKLPTVGLDDVWQIGFVGENDSHVVCTGHVDRLPRRSVIDRRNDHSFTVEEQSFPNMPLIRVIATAHPEQVVITRNGETLLLCRWPSLSVIHTLGERDIHPRADPTTDVAAVPALDHRMNTAGTHLMSIRSDGVIAYDVFTNTLLPLVPFPDRIAQNDQLIFHQLCVDFDAVYHRLLIWVESSCTLVEFEPNGAARTLHNRNVNVAARGLGFSHDGRHVFVVDSAGMLHVYRTETLELVMSLEWHITPVWAIALSPDGRTLATGGGEGVVKLWPLDRLLPHD